MAKLSKRMKSIAAKADRTKLHSLADAIALVKECANAKFDESIDVAVQLGVDAKKSDQVVRGSSPCSRRVRRPTRHAPPAPRSSAWRISPSRSRRAT